MKYEDWVTLLLILAVLALVIIGCNYVDNKLQEEGQYQCDSILYDPPLDASHFHVIYHEGMCLLGYSAP